jgi:hypothetical protein
MPKYDAPSMIAASSKSFRRLLRLPWSHPAQSLPQEQKLPQAPAQQERQA